MNTITIKFITREGSAPRKINHLVEEIKSLWKHAKIIELTEDLTNYDYYEGVIDGHVIIRRRKHNER